MERLIINKLLDWKNSPYRKPLILKDVRQVGKTWGLKEFGKRYYKNIAYFTFDENEESRKAVFSMLNQVVTDNKATPLEGFNMITDEITNSN